jgi:dTDP-4-amino-4,6-dideoxygalactose transaminase
MKIELAPPFLDDEQRAAILAAFNSGQYILGTLTAAFEREFSTWLGVPHAVAVNSGTSALLLGLKALGVGPGDEVMVPSHTAFPTIEPIFWAGATPVFVEVDDSYTMDPQAVRRALSPATKVLLPVHLYGHPADLDPLMAVARERDLAVLEDCCQAHGAEYRGRKVGTFGRAAAFSFFPSKNMTVAGDGGMLVTADADVAETCRMLRNHGRRSKYEHEMIGLNLRFNEIQAAVGRVQLRHLDEFTAGRRQAARWYTELLDPERLLLPTEASWAKAVYHLFVVRTPLRDRLAEALRRDGIATGIHYPLPTHLQPATLAACPRVTLPVTERLVTEILSLPMHPALTREQVEYVAGRVNAFLAGEAAPVSGRNTP